MSKKLNPLRKKRDEDGIFRRANRELFRVNDIYYRFKIREKYHKLLLKASLINLDLKKLDKALSSSIQSLSKTVGGRSNFSPSAD